MANEKRLIDVNELMKQEPFCIFKSMGMSSYKDGYLACADKARETIALARTVDAVEVPCRIGDRVWAIRSFKGVMHPQDGIVGEMVFTKDMKLHIVVKYVARGEWGKTVFATCEEAQAAIEERRTEYAKNN